MTYWIVAVVLVALLAVVLVKRGGRHPGFRPLDTSGRVERSTEDFHQAFYGNLGSEAIRDIRDVLNCISGATGLPATKLEPGDELGAMAAANGLQRSFLIAHIANAFPEAEGEIMQRTANGEFVFLHHAIALIVNARHRARSPNG